MPTTATATATTEAQPDQMPPLESLEWFQGSPQDLNQATSDNNDNDIRLKVALLIQPNCPGCHTHSIPLANELFRIPTTANDDDTATTRDWDIYCVSTAFEDFEFNTPDALRSLLAGETVGVVRRRMGPDAPHVPLMPVAHDHVVSKEDASPDLLKLAVQAMRKQALDQMQRGRMSPVFIQEAMTKFDKRMLPHKIGHVFYAARAEGTPTWVIHKPDGKILDVAFGNYSKEELLQWIDTTKQAAQATQNT